MAIKVFINLFIYVMRSGHELVAPIFCGIWRPDGAFGWGGVELIYRGFAPTAKV